MIKIVTGLRRCGKSYLLFELFREYLLSSGVKAENIIGIELDRFSNAKYREPAALLDYLNSKINENEKYYIMLELLQNKYTAHAGKIKPHSRNLVKKATKFLLNGAAWATDTAGKHQRRKFIPVLVIEAKEGYIKTESFSPTFRKSCFAKGMDAIS